MPIIPRNNSGLSGEYFVAAELYRRGWSVGMTIGNAKAVDLYAENETSFIKIQVKSIFASSSNGWTLMKKDVKKDCLYIFVNLNAAQFDPPDFYICISREARNLVKDFKSRGTLPLPRMKGTSCKDASGVFQKVCQASLTSDILTVQGWAEFYRCCAKYQLAMRIHLDA